MKRAQLRCCAVASDRQEKIVMKCIQQQRERVENLRIAKTEWRYWRSLYPCYTVVMAEACEVNTLNWVACRIGCAKQNVKRRGRMYSCVVYM